MSKRTKVCCECKRELPLDSFHRCKATEDGRLTKCKDCTKNYMHEYRTTEEYRASRRKNPSMPTDRLKGRVRKQVQKAIEKGKLPRPETLPCADCGDRYDYMVYHHEDYFKPLDVVALCMSCHCKRHSTGIRVDNFLESIHRMLA